MMSFHPDDVVVVFTKDDVRQVLSEMESTLSLDDACKLISRKFDSSTVFEQFVTLIELA